MERPTLGEEGKIAILPKRRVGKEVAVGPEIYHGAYLRSSNQGTHEGRFARNEITRFQVSDGTELLTIPSSAYVEASDSTHTMLVAFSRHRSGRERAIPTFSDFSREQGTAHFKILADLAKVLSRRYENSWFIGTSINPGEWKRQAVQSVKTVHTHVVGIGSETLIPLREMGIRDRAERRRLLADGTTKLGINLMRDLIFTPQFWKNHDVENIVDEIDLKIGLPYPKGYTFSLRGIEALTDPRFFALIKDVDLAMAAAYRELAEVFQQGRSRDILDRPVLRPRDERLNRLRSFSMRNRLSIQSSERLEWLARNIRSAFDEISAAGNDEQARIYRSNTRLFLKGRAYNLMIFPDQEGSGKILISFVPRSLSGGSPLDAMGIYKDQYLADPELVNAVTKRQKDIALDIATEAFADSRFQSADSGLIIPTP